MMINQLLLVNLSLFFIFQILISEVKTGESIASLLSVLDVLTGNAAPYKTVSARAAETSIVIKLPASAISQEFENFPGRWNVSFFSVGFQLKYRFSFFGKTNHD